jgi:hypothetical protein
MSEKKTSMNVSSPDLKVDFDLVLHDQFQESFQNKRAIDPSYDLLIPSERVVMADLPKIRQDSIQSNPFENLEHTASVKFSKVSNTNKTNNLSLIEGNNEKNPFRKTESNLGLLLERNPNQFKKYHPLLFANLKKFGQRIKHLGNLQNFDNAEEKELDIIHDLSHFKEEKKKLKKNIFLEQIPEGFKKQISKNLRLLKNKLEPFHPYGLKLFWDTLNTMIIIFLLFYIPISITFKVNFFDYFYEILYLMIMLFDIMIQMNTFYFQYGMEVRDRRKIIYHYFFTRFWPDLLALIGYFIRLLSPLSYLALLYFFKIYSLLYVNEKLMNRFQFTYKVKGIKDLIMLFLLIILIAHLIACAWSYISDPDFEHNKYELTWIKQSRIENREWYITYLYAYYWAIITVMTVGYGDVVPQNDVERLFALFTISFACMIFAYSINTIGVIVQDINKDSIKFKFYFYFVLFI